MDKQWQTDKNTAAQLTGARIEQLANQWLTQQGLHAVERNYRCRLGEIDIIMLDRQQLVFVEVRYRKQAGFGSPADTVDRRKQQKLVRAARHYLAHRPHHNQRACRFDVLAVQPADNADNKGTLHWHWIQHAFTA